MNQIAYLILFIVPSLFALAFLVKRYRESSAAQRRQILYAAAGALIVPVALYVLFSLR